MWYLKKGRPVLFQKSYTAYLIIRKKEIVLFKSVESELKIIFPAKCLMNLETYSQSSELRTGVPFKHREGKKVLRYPVTSDFECHNSGSPCPGYPRLFGNILAKTRRNLNTWRQIFLCLCILRKKHWQQISIFNTAFNATIRIAWMKLLHFKAYSMILRSSSQNKNLGRKYLMAYFTPLRCMDI